LRNQHSASIRGGEAESGADFKWNRGFIEATIQPGSIGLQDIDTIIGPLMMSTRDAK
jgi:hypothetical protein